MLSSFRPFLVSVWGTTNMTQSKALYVHVEKATDFV